MVTTSTLRYTATLPGLPALDLHLQHMGTVRDMIACCGPRTRLPDARTHAELAGAARPLRRLWVPRTVSPSLTSTFGAPALIIAVPDWPSMIARCGPRTCLFASRSRAELAALLARS